MYCIRDMLVAQVALCLLFEINVGRVRRIAISVSVCLPALISHKPHVETSRNFLYMLLWLWIGPPLITMQYVLYFRLCGLLQLFT